MSVVKVRVSDGGGRQGVRQLDGQKVHDASPLASSFFNFLAIFSFAAFWSMFISTMAFAIHILSFVLRSSEQ